eukprot:c41801_g1_i1 orf=2-277(-)
MLQMTIPHDAYQYNKGTLLLTKMTIPHNAICPCINQSRVCMLRTPDPYQAHKVQIIPIGKEARNTDGFSKLGGNPTSPGEIGCISNPKSCEC